MFPSKNTTESYRKAGSFSSCLSCIFFIIVILLGVQSIGLAQNAKKKVFLWCDPLTNIKRIYNRIGIIDILNKARASGFDAIILGVKSITGEVIYESKIAPRLLDWEDYRVPLNQDPVAMFLEEGHKRNMEIYAAFSVFSEGHMIQRKGPVYDKHADWQTQVYVVENEEPQILPITEWAYGTVAFVNPVREEVQAYEISIIEEFLKKYRNIDGIVLERVRFNSIEADFSQKTRQKFEAYLGSSGTIQWWPKDVFEWQFIDNEWQIVEGNYFQQWIEFRTKVIHDFVSQLVKKIKAVAPFIVIGNRVGAWYPTYYEYGVNWANSSYNSDYEWATDEYKKNSILEDFDFLISACYFPRVTMDEAEAKGAEWWMSVEGAALISMEAVNNLRPVYGAVWTELFKDNEEGFKSAAKTVFDLTNGLAVFDLDQIEKFRFWDEIRAALKPSSGKAKPSP